MIPFNGSVFKIDARTKHTAGSYSEYKVKCQLDDDRHMGTGFSSEFAYVGTGGHLFCGPGDSGCVAFDANGAIVGLLFSGQEPQGTKSGYGLITPIEDVFNDIKQFYDREITDIRVAVS